MATFLCWDPDDEEEEDAEEDEGNLVEAYSAESAAETYAETCNNRGDFAEERTICVRDEDGEVTQWGVEAIVTHYYQAGQVDA